MSYFDTCSTLKKHHYPNFGELSLSFDIPALLQAFYETKNKPPTQDYAALINARSYIAKHFPIREQAYEYYPLTEMPKIFLENQGKNRLTEISSESGPRQYRRGIAVHSKAYVPELDERLYTSLPEWLSPAVQTALAKFKGQVSRVRFAVLKGNFHIQEHVDNNLNHSIRIHIPLLTNEKCLFGVKTCNEWDYKHLPANGRAFFVNTAYPHQVRNDSDVDRIHLIVNLNSQEDIWHLRRMK